MSRAIVGFAARAGAAPASVVSRSDSRLGANTRRRGVALLHPRMVPGREPDAA